MDGVEIAWIDRELEGCSLADARLGKRLAQIGDALGASIPLAFQDWANTKAAYRFFATERVNEADILAGHFASTRDRAAAADAVRSLQLSCFRKPLFAVSWSTFDQ
ncbi:MAG: IS4/Tn5 family transposase DNA-binding protein [Gemmataceae bacterium]